MGKALYLNTGLYNHLVLVFHERRQTYGVPSQIFHMGDKVDTSIQCTAICDPDRNYLIV